MRTNLTLIRSPRPTVAELRRRGFTVELRGGVVMVTAATRLPDDRDRAWLRKHWDELVRESQEMA